MPEDTFSRCTVGLYTYYCLLVFTWPVLFEPAHDKTYSQICATREDLDQPAHLHSLITVFTDPRCFLQLLAYPKRDKKKRTLAIPGGCTG